MTMNATARAMQLGDVIRFGNGRAIKPGGEGRYPVYGSNGIIGGCDEFRYENGVIIGRVGAYCGSVAYCPEKFWASDNTLVAFPASEQTDTKFLFYLLTDAKLSRFAGGAAQPLVTQTVLKQVEVSVPPLPVQRRIAGILSAYDELMENSQRRIRLLEAMARALYREWFVHFRAPGMELNRRINSPLGPIPQDWEVKKIGEILELNYGKALKKEDRRDGDFPVYGSSGIVGTHDTNLVKGPGIIVGRKGNVGSVFWCDEDFFVIDTAYFVTSSLPLRFLFYVLPTLNFINSDAAVPGLSRNQAYTLEILIPPAALLKKFCELSDTFERQASTLQRQIQNLRRTRDLLLPRLLSGQVALNFSAAPVSSKS
jgi:type I restriction enzyme S subunit